MNVRMEQENFYEPCGYCDILYEYNEYLLGNIENLSRHFFRMEKRYLHELILCVLKYVFEDLMKWSPYDVRDRLNDEVIDALKLRVLIEKLDLPGEIDPTCDYFYIAHLLYPNIIRFNDDELNIKIYKERLVGKRNKLPKRYFEGADGEYRASLCLRYITHENLAFKDKKDIYLYFESSEGTKFLKEVGLSQICTNKFPTKLDYLQSSLLREEQDDFWYNYCKFNTLYKKQKSLIKKKNKAKKEV